MIDSPFFSIIIPTYNRADFIRKTIESVLSQSFPNFEIIVVDDGSTDNTENIVKSIGSHKIHYYKKENGERAAARNFGVKVSKGHYINFLDSDDVIYSNHFQVAKDFIVEHQGVEIFCLGYDIKDEQNNLLRSVGNIESINRSILTGNILSCNCVLIRKDIISQNQFNEDRALSSLEDWELWIRMSSRYPFLSSKIITSTVVQHEARSVMSVDTFKIKEKVDKFIHYVSLDESNKRNFGNNLNKAIASALTYAALHLIMANSNRKEVLYYLMNGIQRYPGEILKKRFLVIVKKLVGFSIRQ